MQKEELIQLLNKYHLRPEKKLGQHYLIDESVLEQIIEAADIKKEEKVLEIGAGPGILTRELAKAGAEVLALEFDQRFCRVLQEEFHNWRNVHVLCQDALRLDFTNLSSPTGGTPDRGSSIRSSASWRIPVKDDNIRKIVANIPYQITNPLVRKILEPGSVIETAVLLVQKEVAERLTAPPGSSERGILTIMVEMYGSIEKIADVPPSAFWPEPKVTSAIIKISRKNKSLRATDMERSNLRDRHVANAPRDDISILDSETKAFFWFVKQGLSGKRKILANSLSGSLRLPKSEVSAMIEKAGVQSNLRAEDLTLEAWVRLFQEYRKISNS